MLNAILVISRFHRFSLSSYISEKSDYLIWYIANIIQEFEKMH